MHVHLFIYNIREVAEYSSRKGRCDSQNESSRQRAEKKTCFLSFFFFSCSFTTHAANPAHTHTHTPIQRDRVAPC